MKKVKTAISLFLLSAILMAGGSDGYGYTWTSSLDQGGPTYSWYDIMGFGGPLSLSGDDQFLNGVPLGFDFPYYGNTYNSFGISTNGFIAFGNIGDAAYTNQQLPDVGNAGNMLAIFWDDLHFKNDMEVDDNRAWSYYDTTNNRHIIEFYQVPTQGTLNKNTFQIMLYEDGTIVYQYQNMWGDLNGATVGWQNSNGSEGHTIIRDAAFLQSNMAIRIEYSDSPKNFFVANGDLKATLNWEAAGDANLAGYYLYRGTSANPTTVLDSVMGGTSSKNYYFDTGLDNGTTYHYRLRKKYTDGSFSDYSDNISLVPNEFAIIIDGSDTDWNNIRQIYNDPIGDVGSADIDSLKINADGFHIYGGVITNSPLDNDRVEVYLDTDFNAGSGMSESGIGSDYKFIFSPWGVTEFYAWNQSSGWVVSAIAS